MKKYLWIIIVIAIILILPSCARMSMKPGSQKIIGHLEEKSGAPVSAPMDDRVSTSEAEASVEDKTKKVIWTANLSMFVNDFKKSATEIENITIQFGGEIAGKSSNTSDNYVYGTMTLWVPSEKLQQFIKEVEKVGKVNSSNVSAQDISDQYYDLKARLETKKKQESRLLSLLDRKDVKLQEILQLEQELARVRGEIESMEGRKQFWDKQVAYSTVTINITQDVQAVKEPDDIWKPLRKAMRDLKPTFVSSTGVLVAFFAGIITLVAALIPWIIILLLIMFVWKKTIGKNWTGFRKTNKHQKANVDKAEKKDEFQSEISDDGDK